MGYKHKVLTKCLVTQILTRTHQEKLECDTCEKPLSVGDEIGYRLGKKRSRCHKQRFRNKVLCVSCFESLWFDL